MNLADYTYCDATELARLLAARELDAAEVREAALRAIEAVDGRLNAVVGGPYEDAIGDERGPLAGVPMAIKDTLPEAGRSLGFGSRLLEGFVARRDERDPGGALPCHGAGRPGAHGDAGVRLQH